MPPPIAAAALAALEILHSEPERRARLRGNARQFAAACAPGRPGSRDQHRTKRSFRVMTGNSIRAVALSQRLFERNINVQPIIAPAVPDGLRGSRFS